MLRKDMKPIQHLCDEFAISPREFFGWAGIGLLMDIDITKKAGRLSEAEHMQAIENFIYVYLYGGDKNEDQ